MKEPRSPHVLNASASLIGVCFLVVTSLRFFDKSSATIVDELATIAMVFFMAASILSFLALNKSAKHSQYLEWIANLVFLIGLLLLFVTTLFFSFRWIS